MNKFTYLFTILLLLILFETVYANEVDNKKNTYNNYFTPNSTISDVLNFPLFKGFAEFLLPLNHGYNADMPLSQVSNLMPYHTNVDPEQAVASLNYMIDEINSGLTICYPIYDDPRLQKNTALFYFRGKANAPFAVVCAGGGFSYVGSIHEAFPLAIELAKKGYNAFVIQYRTDRNLAYQDLGQAISYIFANSEKLQVSTKGYSLWGGSAGARMAAYCGTNPPTLNGTKLPQASAVIMQYTGYADYSKNDPPTFAVGGENDHIANPSVMRSRIDALNSLGIATEFHQYPNIGHGFGLGTKTSAENWLNLAVDFWEKHIKQ